MSGDRRSSNCCRLAVSLWRRLCRFDQNRLASARAAYGLISIDGRITDALPRHAQGPRGWGRPPGGYVGIECGQVPVPVTDTCLFVRSHLAGFCQPCVWVTVNEADGVMIELIEKYPLSERVGAYAHGRALW